MKLFIKGREMRIQIKVILFITLVVMSHKSMAVSFWQSFGGSAKNTGDFKIEPFYNLHRYGIIKRNNIYLSRRGYSYGGRAGPRLFSGVNLGFDYRVGKIVMERFPNTGLGSMDTKYYGAYISYEKADINFRGTWFFHLSEDNRDTSEILMGKGFSLGMGFKVGTHLSINLEFFRMIFDEIEDANGNISPISAILGIDELRGSDFLFGLSFPISM